VALRVGIDVGGTFTDFVVVSSAGETVLWKEDTTPPRFEVGVRRGLEGLAGAIGVTLHELLDGASLVHGTTAATNTVVERSGPRTGLVCSRGFRDVLYFRDGFKWSRFDRHLPRPPDLVERSLRLPVDGRIDARGREVRALDESDVLRAAETFRDQRVGAVAVALLWSHVNPGHERRVRELLAIELPGVPILISSDVLPELGEWVRTATTVLSAYVYSSVAEYLEGLGGRLRADGLATTPLVMQANGGCAGAEEALRAPVSLIGSGPAAAPAAARVLAKAVSADDVISMDMGGTSFDVCLIRAGAVPLRRGLQVAHQPIGIPGVEINSVAAGGGSVAWVDSGGALRVGPASAGADPGPAAYGRGGDRPTVTDAHVVLGYLSPGNFLGGRRPLSFEAAEGAIRVHIAEPLGIDIVAAAAGILRVVETVMVSAIRLVSVERGFDPRSFLLLAGGGAGPLHAARLAAALGIERVLVPAEAGTLSAFGMTVSDVRLDAVAALHLVSGQSSDTFERVAALVADLERDVVERLLASGFDRSRIRLVRTVDARYVGQVHELITSIPDGPLDDAAVAAIVETFGRLHAERFSYALPGVPVEFLHWRVAGVGDRDSTRPAARPESRPTTRRLEARSGRAYFAEIGEFVETPRHEAAGFERGESIVGPAIIDAPTTTVLIPPNHLLSAIGEGAFTISLPADPLGAARRT
jgi:N-methylhydantoinase A